MTIVTSIENVGTVDLGLNTNGEYELLDRSSDAAGVEVPLEFNSSAITPGDGYIIIQAQSDGDGGYTLLLTEGEGYLTWAVNSSGVLSDVLGQPVDVFAAEELFGVPLNDDGVIGTPPETVTSTGSDLGTDDVVIGVGADSGQYYVIDNSGAAPVNVAVSFPNGPVLQTAFADLNFTMVAAVANPDGAGYLVLFENTSDGSYSQWTLDENGARTARVTLDEAGVLAAETTFGVDLVDEPVGETVTSTGSDLGTDDVVIGVGADSGQYYVIDNSGAAPVNVAVSFPNGPVLQTAFADLNFTMVAAVANPDGAGYLVLFENTSDGSYSQWTLDENGARTARVTLDEAGVLAAETTFGVDLVDEPVGETVTSTGSDLGTDDVVIGVGADSGQYYVIDNSGAAPVNVAVSFPNGPVLQTAFADLNFTMVAAVANPDGAGYLVLFENTSDGSYSQWTLDENGARTARVTLDEAGVLAAETTFGVDLVDEPVGETVTSTGSDLGTDDVVIGVGADSGQYYVIDNSGAAPVNVAVSFPNGPVLQTAFADLNFTMVAAVANPDGAGYLVLFENTSDGSYSQWTLDENGARTARVTLDEAGVLAAETTFGVDLVDEPVGETVTSTGSDLGTDDVVIGVGADSGQYYVIDNSGAAPVNVAVSFPNGPVLQTAFADLNFTMVAAVANPDGAGYLVLFENTSDGSYSQWTLDENGARTARVTLDEAGVLAAETTFGVDLVDEPVGETVTSTGSDLGTDDVVIGVGADSGQYYVIDNSGAAPVNVAVSFPNGPVLQTAFADLNFTMVAAVANPDGAGYLVLFENTSDGSYSQWTLDENGARTARVTLDEAGVLAAETTFGVDLVDEPVGETVTSTGSDLGTDDVVIGVGADSGQYYVIDNSGAAPVNVAVSFPNGPVLQTAFADLNFTMVAAVANPDGAGYLVLFENTSDGSYSQWTLDENGARTARVTLDEAGVLAAETTFGVDLVDEPVAETVTSFGLDEGADAVVVGVGADSNQYYVIDNSGAAPVNVAVSYPLGPVEQAAFSAANFAMIEAVANPDGAGYLVLFLNTSDGSYSQWTLDENGARTERETLDDLGVLAAETTFGVDLDGDIDVGVIEDIGDIALKVGTSREYILEDLSGDEVGAQVTVNVVSIPVTARLDLDGTSDTFVWNAVAAENDPDAEGNPDGFRLLWEGTNELGEVTDYRIWELNDQGSFIVEEAPSDVVLTEDEFGYDIPDTFVFALA